MFLLALEIASVMFVLISKFHNGIYTCYIYREREREIFGIYVHKHIRYF